jgi:hypothetical protein
MTSVGILAQELVVVAGHVDHRVPRLHRVRKTPQHVAVGLGPVDGRAHAPAVDDVAHQVKLVAGVVLEEVQQAISLATLGAEVDVGEKDRPVVGLAGLSQVWLLIGYSVRG